MKIYPLKLTPIRKNAIWGGKSIAPRFGIGGPGDTCAEAWMLSLRPDGENRIENAAAIGMTLSEYAREVGAEQLCGTGSFPLLIKIIDAADRLSVQVHPDDMYAKAHGLDAGKTEMWYILDAAPGAQLVYGVRPGVTPEQMKAAAENGTCEELLNFVPVKKGDCFYIPAGLVHAIGEGILIAEIQQNSNTTYRLYDYNRTDKDGNKRELHTQSAAAVMKTSFDRDGITVGKCTETHGGVREKILCDCPYFSVTARTLDAGSRTELLKRGVMLHILCTEGSGMLEFDDVRYPIHTGDSYLLPQALGNGILTAQSNTEILISTAAQA